MSQRLEGPARKTECVGWQHASRLPLWVCVCERGGDGVGDGKRGNSCCGVYHKSSVCTGDKGNVIFYTLNRRHCALNAESMTLRDVNLRAHTENRIYCNQCFTSALSLVLTIKCCLHFKGFIWYKQISYTLPHDPLCCSSFCLFKAPSSKHGVFWLVTVTVLLRGGKCNNIFSLLFSEFCVRVGFL